MEYATKENLILPSCGLIPEDRESDHILGANGDYEILQPSGNWVADLLKLGEEGDSIYEFQRLKDGRDLYWCVTFSSNNADKLVHRRKYGSALDMDERFIAVGAGTIPYSGTSQQAVEDFKRKSGFLVEKFKAENMTWDQCWAKLTDAEREEAAKNLEYYNFTYKFLDRAYNGFSRLAYSTEDQMREALIRRPVNACVDGRYEMDEQGRIGGVGKGIQYNHAIVVLGETVVKGVRQWWDVWDSESKQLLKFVPDYKFGYCYIKDIIKTNAMQLYKKKGSPAIYFLNPADKKLVPYSDGRITGGEMFKLFFGDYKFAPTQVVDELPYEVADYSITTI